VNCQAGKEIAISRHQSMFLWRNDSRSTHLNVPVVDPVPTHLLADITDHNTGFQLERPALRTDISISVNPPRHIVHDMTWNASDNAKS
jgi:hypothetical protein